MYYPSCVCASQPEVQCRDALEVKLPAVWAVSLLLVGTFSPFFDPPPASLLCVPIARILVNDCSQLTQLIIPDTEPLSEESQRKGSNKTMIKYLAMNAR